MDIPYFRDDNKSVVIDGQYFYDNLELTIPYITVLCLVSFMGTFGNTLVIIAVLTSKKLRTVANMFIVNLAVADICVSAFVDMFSIIAIKEGEVFFNDKWALCEMVASVCLTSCFCSLLSIGGISFNRCIHICYHRLYEKIFTFKKAMCMISGLWVISFLMEMPSFFGWGDHVYDRKTLSCIWDRTHSFSYTLFFALGGVGVPWSMTVACYVKIFTFVSAAKRNLKNATNAIVTDAKQAKEKSESMKLARTLFIIFVVFTVCWTPYAIIIVSDTEDEYSASVHSYSVLIAHTNSSLNFILYGVTNTSFRQAYSHTFRRIFCCFKSGSVAPMNETVTTEAKFTTAERSHRRL